MKRQMTEREYDVQNIAKQLEESKESKESKMMIVKNRIKENDLKAISFDTIPKARFRSIEKLLTDDKYRQ